MREIVFVGDTHRTGRPTRPATGGPGPLVRFGPVQKPKGLVRLSVGPVQSCTFFCRSDPFFCLVRCFCLLVRSNSLLFAVATGLAPDKVQNYGPDPTAHRDQRHIPCSVPVRRKTKTSRSGPVILPVGPIRWPKSALPVRIPVFFYIHTFVGAYPCFFFTFVTG